MEEMEVNLTFWNKKRVLITGHTGFKGSWLSLWLQSLGAEVTGYANTVPTSPSLFKVADISNGMKSITGDIRDLDNLHTVIQKNKPEIIIHMAAQSLVRNSYTDPIETYSSNVMGTVNLFEAIRRSNSVRAVVNVTSDKCYENREWNWGYRETEAMGGFDPYSSSKGCAELITAAYRNSFFNHQSYNEHGVSVASARAGNVIGGGDWADDRLIPDVMRAITNKTSVQIRNPNAIRPWQHVLEPLSGYLQLAEQLFDKGPEYAEGWNFGPSDTDAKPVQWIVEKITQNWGDGVSWKLDEEVDHPHESNYLKLDSSNAKDRLNWRHYWGLEKALSRTVQWYKAYYNKDDMHKFTLHQIKKYQEDT